MAPIDVDWPESVENPPRISLNEIEAVGQQDIRQAP